MPNKTTFDRLRATSIETIEPLSIAGQSPFNEVQTAEFSPLIELDSSNGLSPVYRDKITTTNSGSVTNVNGEHKVSTGATASSTAGLGTQERGRYQPGIVGLPGVAIRRPTAPTGNQEIRWGYFDDQDGFYFGEDSTGVFVQLRNGGSSRSKVYQQDWGVDTLDGSGGSKNPSGLTLDLTKSTVFRLPFVWYGGGPIELRVLLTDPDDGDKPVLVTVHRFASVAGETIVQNAKLPVNVEADNGGDSKTIDIFVAGRQFAVLGRYDPNRRETTADRLAESISTTDKPMITYRKKSDRKSQTKSVKVSGLGVISDSDAIIKIVLGGTLSAGTTTFTSIDGIGTGETALEVNTTATEITGGTVIDRSIVSGGAGNNSNFAGVRRLGLDIPDDVNVSLVMRTVSGTGSATPVFSLEEES